MRPIAVYGFTALVLLVAPDRASAQGIITTVAGTDYTFHASGQPATVAPLGQVPSLAVDAAGNVYASDVTTNLVVKVSPDGILQVVAGNGISGFSGDGGKATSAALSAPYGVAVDAAGNLYIADSGNDRIRMVSPTGTISTVAGNGQQGFSGDGGPATSASLSGPYSVATDTSGNLYIADQLNNRIRRVDATGMITTVAGNGQQGYSGDGGPATSASLNVPLGVAVDAAGNLYIADQLNYRIRMVSKTGNITTVAGNGQQSFYGDRGPATNAALSRPFGVTVDALGNLYIADLDNNRVRMVSAAGIITTVAGNGVAGFSGDSGPAVIASLSRPAAVATSAAGNLYIADEFNYRVRMVSTAGAISTVAGNGQQGFSGDGGPAASASLSNPYGVAVDAAGNLYLADELNLRVRKVTPAGTITTVAGNGQSGSSGDNGPAIKASLKDPAGVAVDAAGNLYIADIGSYTVRKVDTQGIIRTVAGSGVPGFFGDGSLATRASLQRPFGVAVDSNGNLYIADLDNNRVRKVDAAGIITTVAGSVLPGYTGDGGPATNARLHSPAGVAVDAAGNLYIDDLGNNAIRKVDLTGTIRTVAGNGQPGFLGDGGPATLASLGSPLGFAVDSIGNLYIADTSNYRVRMVNAAGTISTVAGNGVKTFSGDGGLAVSASLRDMEGVAVDRTGNLFIADSYNHRIREVLALPPVFTASPAALTFTASSGGVAPSPQAIHIAGSVQSIPFTTQDLNQVAGSSWLTLSASSGTLPFDLQVKVDPSQLTPGTYTDTVVVTVPASSTAPISVQISFTVTAPVAQQLGVSDPSLSFSLTQGTAPATSQLTLSNQGSGSLDFTASAIATSGGSWISISPSSGTVTAGSPVSLSVTADPGSLAAGTYSGSIALASLITGQSLNVPATFTVSSPPQKLVLSQLGFTFVAVSQGGTVLSQSLGILNGGSGPMHWTAQTVTTSGSPCGWLDLSASSGIVTQPLLDVSTVDVSINAQGLALPPASYYCLIQVSADNAVNSPQSALVVLDMLPAGSNPGPNLQPSNLVFTGVAGAPDPGSKAVLVANVTSANIDFGSAVAYDPGVSPWLKYLPLNATVTPNQPTQIVIQPTFGGLAPGTYHATLTLLFTDGGISTIGILALISPAGATPAPPSSGDRPARSAPKVNGCLPATLYPIATKVGSGSIVPAGWPSTIYSQVMDDCGNTIDNGSVVASFDNGDPPLSLTDVQNGQWSVSWTPAGVSANRVTVTLKAAASGLNGMTQKTIDLGSGQSQPIVASLLSPVSLTPGPLAPGDLMLLQGSGLAGAQASSASNTLVLIGGRPAQLLYVNPSQVIALVPAGAAVNTSAQVAVTRDATVVLLPAVNIAAAHPTIWSADGTGQGQALAYNAPATATTLADVYNPAPPGAPILIYCSGLGAVDAQGNATNSPTVSIGGVAATVTYAGVALPASYPPSGAPMLLGVVSADLGGLYQINATVPTGVPAGPAQVAISSANQTSQSGVTIMIAPAP